MEGNVYLEFVEIGKIYRHFRVCQSTKNFVINSEIESKIIY